MGPWCGRVTAAGEAVSRLSFSRATTQGDVQNAAARVSAAKTQDHMATKVTAVAAPPNAIAVPARCCQLRRVSRGGVLRRTGCRA